MKSKIWAVLACLLPFFGFWTYGLFDLDEGFYGAVVKDMLRRGDWITPTLNGHPWFEKPILSYWLAMPTVALFGNEFGARLPSFLATILTAWLWYRFMAKRCNHITGLLTATAYCGSLLVVGVGRMMMTDAPLVLAMTAALFAWLEIAEGRPRQLWLGLAVGLGILAKGPVAGALPLATGLAACWWVPAWRITLFKRFWIALVVAIAVACLWFVPCYLANRDVFVQEFLIKQNIGRFAGGDKAHAVPLYFAPLYYPVILLLALAPWTVWLKKDVYGSIWQGWKNHEATWQTMVSIYAVVVLIFFSISGSKLPHYILPAVGPFLALLIDAGQRVMEDSMPRLRAAQVWNLGIAALAITVFVWIDDAQFVDVRRLAFEVNGSGQPLAVLSSTGTAKKDALGEDETSSPSLGFYLTNRYRDNAKLDDLINEQWTGLLFVRKGAVTPQTQVDASYLGRQLKPVDQTGNSFELWSLELGQLPEMAIPHFGRH